MDKFTVFGWVCFLIVFAHIFWSEVRRAKKMNEMVASIRVRYPEYVSIMVTSQGVAIYIVEDQIWIDSGYLNDYIETRVEARWNRTHSRRVNWQKEGF